MKAAHPAPTSYPKDTPSATPMPSAKPSHELSDYVGHYEHPGYGRVSITQSEGNLHWAFRGMFEALEHRHYDTFELPEAPKSPGSLLPGRLPVSFSTSHDGRVASLAIPFEPLVKDIVFYCLEGVPKQKQCLSYETKRPTK